MSKGRELKVALDTFEKLLEKTADEKDLLSTFANFLRGFLRIRDPKHALPTAEIMTIIKNKKPTIFYLLKKQSHQNPTLELLTELEMDYTKAVERLEALKKELK